MSQSKARAARKSSLRDQLARKRARVVTAHFPLDDEGDKALERYEQAVRLLETSRRLKQVNPKSDMDLAQLEREVAEAEKVRDEHCLVLRFRGLTEDERDALASEFVTEEIPSGASDEDKERILQANKAAIQGWTFAAMAAVVVDSDLTAEEWREELTSDRWTAGDMVRIRESIQSAYGVQPADGIPKG